MRPGQLTPEKQSLRLIRFRSRPARRGFNEAGAINPGKLRADAAPRD